MLTDGISRVRVAPADLSQPMPLHDAPLASTAATDAPGPVPRRVSADMHGDGAPAPPARAQSFDGVTSGVANISVTDDDDSSAGDLATHLDLAPARFSWWGSFADRAAEAAYSRRELRKSFARAVPRVMVIFSVLSVVIAVQEGVANGTFLRFSTLATLALALVTGVLCVGVPLGLRAGMSMRSVEVPYTVGMSVMGAVVQFSHPYRAALIFDDRAFVAATSHLSWSQTSMYMRAITILCTVGLWTPIQTPHFFFVSLATVAATVAGRLIAPLPHGGDDVRDTFLFGMTLLLLFGTHARVVRAERNKYHFHRAVYRAVVERQGLERKEHDHRLRAKEAEAAKDARAKLIRVVMHDLRSPLLSVANMSEMLAGKPHATTLGEPVVQRAVESIGSCAQLMENIVSDMLDFERIDSGRLELVHAPFSTRQLLASALSTFAPIALKKGVALDADPLPLTMRRARYVGDVLRLTQCLNNGISNAIKFTPAGGRVRLRMAERAHADGPDWAWLDIDVVDTGSGLSPAELEVLRTQGPFSQVGQGQLQGNGGTGLGLNIVRSVLALHNDSHLELASEGTGRGTRFALHVACPRAQVGNKFTSSASWSAQGRASCAYSESTDDGSRHRRQSRGLSRRSRDDVSHVTSGSGASDGVVHMAPGNSPCERAAAASTSRLPAAAAADPEMASPVAINDDAPSAVAASEAVSAATALRCLHVEDDMMLRFTLGARLFEPRDLVCDVAEDGAQAVAMVRQRPGEYSLVLMDNQMPNMGGTTATRALRELGYSGVVIGMTGDPSGSPDRREFEAAGLDVCVDKTTTGLDYVANVLDDMIKAKRAGGDEEAAARVHL